MTNISIMPWISTILLLIMLILSGNLVADATTEVLLRERLREAISRNERLRSLNELVNYFRNTQTDSALVYAQRLVDEALASVQSDTDTFEVGLAHSQLAKTWFRMDSMAQAEKTYHIAAKWFRAGRYTYQIPDILIDLGQIELRRENQSLANTRYHEARALAHEKWLGYEESGDEIRANLYKSKWAHAEYALAHLYMLIHERDSVLPYLETALRLYEEMDEEWGIANCLYTRAQYVREYHRNYAAAFDDLIVATTQFQAMGNTHYIEDVNWELKQLFEQADYELELSKLRYWALGGGLILVVLITIILYISYRKLRVKNQTIDFYRRELQHRFGNNLQMLENLMHLQLARLQDEPSRQALRSSISRVEVIFNLLKQFYDPSEVGKIPSDGKLDLKPFLEKLVDQLIQVAGREGNPLTVRRNIAAVKVSLETARSINLVVNECLTNAIKYAFPVTEDPVLEISLQPINQQNILLIIADNGPGLTEGEISHRSGSFGLSMVSMLVKRQLKGELTITNNQGTHISITFPNA